MGKQRIYFISGLGADERVFQNLEFSLIEPVFIKWITPSIDETLASYAERLSKIIPENDPNIIGLSFGGMLSVEIAKTHPEGKVLIISAAKNKREIPYDYRVAGKTRIQNLLPMRIIKN
ncbi:MAG TPA: alpha/beta hydrolase, partial [Bacteroidia bacterium]|nr:alpha/beta hydrolase [Bacteroidia bacterium]